MKIAFVGKGGSGKTTIAALFCRHLAASGRPVIAIDADINQHLAVALGMAAGEAESIPALGLEIDRIKDYLRGDNPRIPSAAIMIKTTPPGRGSRLISMRHDNPLFDHFLRRIGDVGLMAVGPFSTEDIGTRCYHSKTGAVELLLNHLIDDSEAHVVVDMTAGADAFASGMFTRFDLTVLVVEPTTRSLSVYDQYAGYAADHDIAIAVIGNKVEDEHDIAFIAERVGDELVTTVSRSSFVRSLEKGAFLPFNGLEPENRAALSGLQAVLESQHKDWHRYQTQAVAFHLRNAASWANAATGVNLAAQVDEGFSLAVAAAKVRRRRTMRAA
jgi:CO dehydrogenase maturation factor